MMTTSIDTKLDAILDAIKSLEGRIARIEPGSGNAGISNAAASATSKKLSIKEFLLAHPPSTDVQRTLAIGYFFENLAGMTSFTSADLEKGYRDAKETAPSNISMNIKRCIEQGHMMEADEKKNNKTAYVTTRSGEQFITAGYKKPAADR